MKTERIPQLDGLRAIAIGMVLATHLWTYPTGDTISNRLFGSGWLGVDLFFVLSGYLISSILMRTRESETYFSTFYLRRALRIFPPYYALLIAVFVLLPLIRKLPTRLSEDEWMFWVYLGNFSLAQGWQLFLVDITWSLAVEEQFYLLWPALIRYADRLPVICVGICIAAPVARFALWQMHVPWPWLHMMMPLRADAFAWGALLAIRPKRFRALAWLIVPIATLAAVGCYARPSMLVNTIGYSANAACAAGIISLALSGGRFARVLSFRPARYLGEVSYEVYLYHPMCLVVATLLLHFGIDALGGLERIAVTAPLAVGVAALSHRFFERPILKLKARLPVVA